MHFNEGNTLIESSSGAIGRLSRNRYRPYIPRLAAVCDLLDVPVGLLECPVAPLDIPIAPLDDPIAP